MECRSSAEAGGKVMRDTILQILKSATVEDYRPIVFWSINSALTEKEICRQVAEMRSFGLGGFVFHARAGLLTEYLSEEWFGFIGTALEAAEKHGMRVWLYDEFGWPSGFAGGRLLREEKNRACYLEYAIKERYDPAAYAVYVLEDGGPRLLHEEERAGCYHTLYLRVSDAYVDILDPQVTEQFIALTHEQYYKRLKGWFGKTLLGFFTDEPQYYRYATPFSRAAEESYRQQYGSDVKEGLLWLFLKDERGYPFRIRYYNLLNRLYCKNYYQKIYAWCERHGCQLTGHSIEEGAFFAQMWGGADCAASYLYEHVPAIDHLARHSDPFISAKNVASVAAQTGRRHILTETFGCTGYGITPRELRLIAERQYVCGVNTMCQHLYNYSLAGQGKIDHPVSFGRSLPWIEGYPAFNDYFAKLGYLLGNASEDVPVAVISPMESVYLDYIRLDEEETIARVDGGYAKIAQELRKEGIAYHLVDEKVLSLLGRIEEGKLFVGERGYEAVVLANCRDLKPATAALLRRFTAAGGRLKTMGETPCYLDGEPSDLSDLVQNCDLPRPEGIVRADIAYTMRKLKDGKCVLFAVNDSPETRILETSDDFCSVDLVRGIGYRSCGVHTLPPHSSLLLERDGGYEELPFEGTSHEMLIPEFVGGGDNCLTLECAAVMLADGTRLSGYVYGIFERLVRSGYRGSIEAEFSFESEAEFSARLTVERQPVSEMRFNGGDLEWRDDALDCNFCTADVRIRRGKNAFTYCAECRNMQALSGVLFGDTPESLRNCVSYFTCLEPVYLEGAFDSRGNTLLPPSSKTAGDLTRMGYENFCGSVRYRILVPGGHIRLRPLGEFAMCTFSVCGKKEAVLLKEEAEFILPAGEHICEIVCASTMRNRFGPFHCRWREEDGVSPDHFTLRGGWTQAGENENYVEERKLIPFGLHAVELIRDIR